MTGPPWPRNKVRHSQLHNELPQTETWEVKRKRMEPDLWETKLPHPPPARQGIKAFLLKYCKWFCSATCWQLHILESFIFSQGRKFSSWCMCTCRPLPVPNNYFTTSVPSEEPKAEEEDGSVCVLPASTDTLLSCICSLFDFSQSWVFS